MSMREKCCVEQSSIMKQDNESLMDEIIEKYEWNSLDEAMRLVIECAEDVKRITDLCIKLHFSPAEQERIHPQLFPVYTDPAACLDEDKMAPFVRFIAHDIDGKVVLSAEIVARGLYVFKYRPTGSKKLIMDNAPFFYVEDAPPDELATTKKWEMFTEALTRFLKLGYSNEVLRAFLMDTTWEWDIKD